MRKLIIAAWLLSSMVSAQEVATEAHKASLPRAATVSPIIRKTNPLAAPATPATQHQQTDLDFLKERTSVATEITIGNGKLGGFICPEGFEPACLNAGDKVCPGTTKCVDDGATCLDDFPCDPGGGFVCGSQYDDMMNGYKKALSQNDELASNNVALREKRLEIKNCVLNASTLIRARSCVR